MTHELTGDGLRDFTIFGFVTEWRRVALDTKSAARREVPLLADSRRSSALDLPWGAASASRVS